MRRLSCFVFAVVFAACGSTAPVEPAPSEAQENARRLAGILDYVAADYGGAVKDGAIASAAEYDEQVAFMQDAAVLAKALGADVAKVQELVLAKADATQVASAARAVRKRVLDTSGVVLAPAAPPSRTRAQALFEQSCAPCHGVTGAGDGPQGLALKPPPRSFVDAEVMAEMSPVRAFNALTDGMKGTAMPSWGGLSPSDRWSLAFYVMGLRHAPADAQQGRAIASQLPLARLAGATDGELLATMTSLGDAERGQALAYLRRALPFAASGAPLDPVRQALAEALAAARRGDSTTARQAAGRAYLDGFEPHEGALRAHDPELVTRCEEIFLRVRELAGTSAALGELEREALQLGALLDRAEEVLAGGDADMAFVAALVVVLREGVEAALLIMLLLGLSRRNAVASTDGAGDARAVHWGWLGALTVGAATWFASAPLMRLGGASRELMEGIISFIAATVLLATGHFVIARIDAKHRVDAMKRRLAQAGTAGRRRTALAGLAFLAVYREAFEVVLFLRAIAFDANGSPWAVLLGAAAGALLLVGVVALLLRLGKRLKPAPLLATMGTLLCLLAIVLAGKGVRAFQEAGLIGIRPLEVPRVDWLGFYPSLEGVVAQLAVLSAFVAIALAARRARATAVAT